MSEAQQLPHQPGDAFQARVLFDYGAVEASELSVTGGEVVEVEEVNASGWALAKNSSGQTGWLPADYVERIDNDLPSPPPAAPQLTTPTPTPAPAPVQSSSSSSSTSTPATADVNEALQKLKLASQDPQTGSQRICAGCGEAISSAFVLAKDAAFHPSHFRCTTCSCELGGRAYMEHENKFYCEDDYYEAFNPKCHDCKQLIKGPYVSALDVSWHPEHFVCTVCKSPFPDQQFRKHEGRPYCELHFGEFAASRCTKCSKPILGQVFEAVDKKWHLECFTCAHDGHRIGEGQPFHVGDKADSDIYCPEHYELKFLEKCNVCAKPIKGQYIKVMDKQLHSECWRCTECKVQLKPENAASHQGRFVCRTCLPSLSKSTPAPSSSSSSSGVEAKAAAALSKLESLQVSQAQAQIASASSSSASSFADPGTKTYPYDKLRTKETKPADVDPARKEQYLSDAQFNELFKMNKTEFAKLPDWKKEQLKKPLGLF